jgi:hypothetical protein
VLARGVEPGLTCLNGSIVINADQSFSGEFVGTAWARYPLANRCRTNENPATSGQRWPVHHAATVETCPGGMPTATCAARLVPDEHRAGAERVTVRAALRRPRHP